MVTTDQVYVILICKLSEDHKQLEHLLLQKDFNKSSTVGTGTNRKDLLKFVIQRHQDIINFGEELCHALSDAFLLQHFFATLTFCFAASTYLMVYVLIISI